MASAAQAAEIAQAVSVLRDLTATKYTTISATTIMLYDIILQFPQEYRLVWKSKFNAFKYAYAINRYLVLGVLCYFSYGLTAPPRDLDDAKCQITPVILGAFGVASVAISNALVYVRVMVLWRRASSIRIALFLGYIICYGVGLTFMVLTVRRLQQDSYFSPVLGACILPVESLLFIGFWTPNMFLDIYAFLLILISLWNRPVGLEFSALKSVYYDAILYSVITASLKLGMIIVLAVNVTALDFVLFAIEWSMVVTVGARFLMKLYSIGHRDDDEESFTDSYPLIHLQSNNDVAIHITQTKYVAQDNWAQ